MTEIIEFIKTAIRHDVGLADIILHIHGGLLILMVARIVSRRSLGSFIPFTCVLVLEVVNEVADRLHYGSWRWEDTTSDFLNTLFWPFVISVGVRLRPMRAPGPVRVRPAQAQAGAFVPTDTRAGD